MTVLPSVLGAATLIAATSKKSSSSSSELSLIVIVGLFAIVYFFFLRPRQQRARQRTTRGRTFDIGDEVMSVGGIYGRVVGLQDDSVDVEVAPGIVLTFLRRAVNPRPAGSPSGTAGARRLGQPEPRSGPYGGPAVPAPPTSSTTDFGVSSGHFDDTTRGGAGQPGDEEGHGRSDADGGWDGEDDEDDEDDDWDFEDEGGGAGAEPAEPAGAAGPEGRAGGDEVGQDADGGPSDSAPDGSATGTPRTTGGPSSEED